MLHSQIIFASLDVNCGRFCVKPAFIDGGLCACQRGNRVVVHILAGQAMFVRGFLSKTTHQASGVGIFQTVQEHMILELAMPQAQAAAGLGNQVGRLGHVFDTACQHGISMAGKNLIMTHHHGFHA